MIVVIISFIMQAAYHFQAMLVIESSDMVELLSLRDLGRATAVLTALATEGEREGEQERERVCVGRKGDSMQRERESIAALSFRGEKWEWVGSRTLSQLQRLSDDTLVGTLAYLRSDKQA